MKTGHFLFGLSLAAAGVVAAVVLFKRSTPEPRQRAERPVEVVHVADAPTQGVETMEVLTANNSFSNDVTPAPGETRGSGAVLSAPPQGTPRTHDEIQDPLARVALSFVGADPDADAYWLEAINDPSLSAHERQDLIEDLNEDGFPDPERPTFEDLPLIVSRLQLIEEVAPYAMDQVNAEAFGEAYKDLFNMYRGLTTR